MLYMLRNLSLGLVILASSQLAAHADGFKLRLEGNKIVAKNNEGIIPDTLFGTAFDITNNVAGAYESSHGSVDANDAGSGFHFPSAGSADSFTFNIRGLWTYEAGLASPATPSAVLQILKPSDRSLLTLVSGVGATPGFVPITATSTHELLWSVPQASPFSVWGLVYSVSGTSSLSGQPYEESAPLVAVQWTPNFQGDSQIAMTAIYAAAVPEPSTIGSLLVAGLSLTCLRRRVSKSASL
jgi:hypothetical protein